jgi:hypothetical protein
MADMQCRMLAALRRRAASGDLEALTGLIRIQTELKVQTRLAALALRDLNGYTWQEIGWAAGINRSAAQERWGS